MKIEVINSLKRAAHNVFYSMIKGGDYGYTGTSLLNKDKGYKGTDWNNCLVHWAAQVRGNGTVRMIPVGNPDAWIEFTSIRPNADAKLVFHPFEITNKTVGGVYTQKTTNLTGSNVSRKFTLSNTQESSQSDSVGVGISATVGASVTVGSAVTTGFEVGINFSTTISASYDKNFSTAESTTENREVLVDVAPRSIMYLDLQKSTGDYSQKTDCFASFDYAINVELGEFKKLSFVSISDMLTYKDGYGNPDDATNGWFAKAYPNGFANGGSSKDFAGYLKNFPVKYSYTNKFKGASTGEVKLRETDLNNKEFNYNA